MQHIFHPVISQSEHFLFAVFCIYKSYGIFLHTKQLVKHCAHRHVKNINYIFSFFFFL